MQFGIHSSGRFLVVLALAVLSGCKGDAKSPPPQPPAAPPPAATYSVGGMVTGLTGSLTLTNNGGDVLTLGGDGTFSFVTMLPTAAAYNVTVTSQPANQTCTVTAGSGTIAASAVTNVTVTCVTNPTSVGSALIGPEGGTVTGLYGAQIIVPAGALATPVTIGIARDSSNAPDFTVPDFNTVGAVFELTPHGQGFSLPVTVRIPFDPEQVPNDSDPALYKAEVAGAFDPLPTTVNGNFLEATVTGFSWVLPAAAATRPRMVYAVENAAGGLRLASLPINRATGALGNATSFVPTGDFPTSVVAHPSGRFVYITNGGSTTLNAIAPNSVTKYGLNAINGQLLAATAASVTTRGAVGAFRPTMPVVHPSGKFLYVMNFGSVTNNGGGDIDMFAIDGISGALTLSGNAITGNGSQPMGIAFNRLGTRAYVLFNGSTLSNPLDARVALFNVDVNTGAFTGPVSTTVVTAPGNASWAITIDPNGKAVYVANVIGNDVVTLAVNATTGALTNLGSLQVRDRPASLAADSFGRFIFTAKQQPLFNVNALSFLADSTTGVLSATGSAMSGCPGGACSGPISLIAEPQGNFAYVIDSVGGITSFAVDQQTGALTNVASRSGAWVPSPGGIGLPFTFAASGVSPVWQSNCTQGCMMQGTVGSGGGGSPPTNPTPPTSYYLSVSQGAYVGSVSSSPSGIAYAPPSSANPLGQNVSANHFPANSSVQLCATAPLQPAGAYDITWMGSCSGTGQCTSVRMDRDKSCHLSFTPVPAGFP